MKKEFHHFIEGLRQYNDEYQWNKTNDDTVQFRVIPADDATVSYVFWEEATKDIKQVLPNAFVFIEEIYENEILSQQTYYASVLHENSGSMSCLSVVTVMDGHSQLDWERNERVVDKRIRTEVHDNCYVNASDQKRLMNVLYTHMSELPAFRLLFVTGGVQ